MQDLRQRKILTKVRRLSSGRAVGGNPLTRGPLAHLLRNRFYIGEVAFKGEILPGEQPAILDRKLFESVQRKLDEQRTNHSTTRTNSESLLMGRIFDDRGNRMTPSYARKNGKRYRYYLSSPLSQGQAEHAGSVRRVPASEIETLVIDAVRKRLKRINPRYRQRSHQHPCGSGRNSSGHDSRSSWYERTGRNQSKNRQSHFLYSLEKEHIETAPRNNRTSVLRTGRSPHSF